MTGHSKYIFCFLFPLSLPSSSHSFNCKSQDYCPSSTFIFLLCCISFDELEKCCSADVTIRQCSSRNINLKMNEWEKKEATRDNWWEICSYLLCWLEKRIKYFFSHIHTVIFFLLWYWMCLYTNVYV